MRRAVVGVLGRGGTKEELEATWKLAEKLGALIAKKQWILLGGGGSGVMKASALGAQRGGGHTIAISRWSMADAEAHEVYAEATLYTGLGDGRNYLTAGLPDAVVAMAGGSGTLSEIGLALKLGTPVVLLGAWEYLTEHFEEATFASSASEAVAALERSLGADPHGFLKQDVRVREMPSQEDNLARFAQLIEEWSGPPRAQKKASKRRPPAKATRKPSPSRKPSKRTSRPK